MTSATKVAISVALIGGLAIAYYLISPLWRVVEMNEAVPVSIPVELDEIQGENTAQEPQTLTGNFVSNAHEASGKALILTTEDGQVLRFEDFETLNGPDLRIYLATDLTNDDFIDLGPIKATKGNVNYTLPENIDLTKYDTVLIWCRAFGVLFGYAEISD